jgi:hypothetical protein
MYSNPTHSIMMHAYLHADAAGKGEQWSLEVCSGHAYEAWWSAVGAPVTDGGESASSVRRVLTKLALHALVLPKVCIIADVELLARRNAHARNAACKAIFFASGAMVRMSKIYFISSHRMPTCVDA